MRTYTPQKAKHAVYQRRVRKGTCTRVTGACRALAPAVEETSTGPCLRKKYHGPHAVPEEGVNRIVEMLRKGDMFRYGGNDEGSLQVCVLHLASL